MALRGGTRKKKVKHNVKKRAKKKVGADSIFMPAPIDWDFVPRTRRFKDDLLQPTIASHIFPYIVLTFERDDLRDTARAVSHIISGEGANIDPV